MAFWQTFLVVLYGFFINWDKEGPKIGTSQPVVAGFLTGLIMGDIQTGLLYRWDFAINDTRYY